MLAKPNLRYRVYYKTTHKLKENQCTRKVKKKEKLTRAAVFEMTSIRDLEEEALSTYLQQPIDTVSMTTPCTNLSWIV